MTTGALFITAVAWMTSAPPALAHADLLEISPADGSTITKPPAVIRLTFTEPILEAAAKAVVTDGKGTIVIADRSTVTGEALRVPWDATLPNGRYTVAYRVVSRDGHPISGQAAFTLEAPVAPSRSASPAAASPTPTGPTGAEPMSLTDPRMLAGALIGTIGGIGIVLLQRRRRS